MINQASRSTKTNRTPSLNLKTVKILIVSCIIFEFTALFSGLSLYGAALAQEYISISFNEASSIYVSVTHGIDCRPFASQVMDIYYSLDDVERLKVKTPEYRRHFSVIDTGEDSSYVSICSLLRKTLRSNNVDDVYIAMYDKKYNALVYIADPDTRFPMAIGDWEPVEKREVSKFLNWDGNGTLYDISLTDKYGWLCTSGVPVRDDAGNICAFVLVDISLNNVITGMAKYALGIILSMTLITALAARFLTKQFKKTLVDPINALTSAASGYVADKRAAVAEDSSSHTIISPSTNRFATLSIDTGDELEDLSRVMIRMEQELTHYEENIARIAADKEKIRTELNMAKTIQENQLPNVFPAFPDRTDFEIYAAITTSKEIGGDFYDYFLIDDDHLGMVIADVSGRGVPAALFMMIVKTLIRNQLLEGISPSEALRNVNNQVQESPDAVMFVTVWACILEISTGKGIVVNAGHEHPAVCRSGGQYTFVRYKHSPVVGALPDMLFQEHEFQLFPGDTLFLYTDGTAEAVNPEGAFFGFDRMLDTLNCCPEATAEQTVRHLQQEIEHFVQGAELTDDYTMMCLRYKCQDHELI